MRAANEKTGNKEYKESKTNLARGKLTGTMPDSEKLAKKKQGLDQQNPETGLLAENRADGIDAETTGILINESTERLDLEATGVLVDENETVLLQETVNRSSGKKLTMIDEVMLIHTDEVIEC